MSFEGKNALVTGASQGIGRAVALELAQGGANVTVNCRSGIEKANEVAEEIRAIGCRALVSQTDVSDQSGVEAMVADTVKEFGSLDVYVSNAAYSDRQVMVDADMEGFQRTINVTMWGAFYGVRAASQQMLKQDSGGAITVVSSPHAIFAIPTSMAYNMAKAAIDHMVRTAAIELVSRGIRVNTFHPGWIDTPGERKFFTEEQLLKGGRNLPMGRLGTSEEMARGIAFTLSDDAAYMTGSIMTMDGGVSLPWWSNRADGEL